MKKGIDSKFLHFGIRQEDLNIIEAICEKRYKNRIDTLKNKENIEAFTGIDPKMIANNIEPFEPTHPGEVLKEEIECRGISQKELSRQTGIPYTALNEVLNGKRAITTEYALLIEAALGIESSFWLRMQTDYNIQTTKRNKTFAKRLESIRKIAAVLIGVNCTDPHSLNKHRGAPKWCAPMRLWGYAFLFLT